MKYLTILILITLYVTNADAYTLKYTDNGNEIKWHAQEITVSLDPSLKEMGEDSYLTVEESFLEWLDYIEEDITVNFVYEDCALNKTNCVRFTGYNEYCSSGVACAYGNMYPDSGQITSFNIDFYFSADGERLKNIALHEIGHFFGLSHSDNRNAIMYKYTNGQTKLQQDDINGIKTLYENVTYPSVEYNPPKQGLHFVSCNVSEIGRTDKGSIFNLLF